MSGVDLGRTVKGAKAELDLQQLATGRTFLCALSGGGKSHLARRVIEQIFGQVGLIVIDVEGEYASLRENYPFLIIGKDVQLTPEAAEFLADQVLDSDLSVIIDGSDPNLDDATFQEFVQRFIDRFIAIETTKRKPYLIIAEEADELAPEHNFARSLCGPAIKKLAKKGRKRGVGIMVVTQRPASVEKGVISQCRNKLIGQLDWDPDKEVVHKFARIPQDITDKLDKFERGDFYVSGDFIAKPGIIHVGPVITKHVGETPEVVPPAPKELASILASLRKDLPEIIREKLVPAVPKVAEIEARLKEKFEAQWETRLARVQKERDRIKNTTEAKYEVQIADLTRKLEDAVRHATLKGGVSDLLTHPLVQKNLEKLNEKQRLFVALLEKGPQDAEHCSLFLEIKPKAVSDFCYDINRKIPKLIENQGGRYVSRLAKLFPVTEEAQAEAKESEKLRAEIVELKQTLVNREHELANARTAARFDADMIENLEASLAKLAVTVAAVKTPTEKVLVEAAKEFKTAKEEGRAPSVENVEIAVDATLHRTLTSFNVTTNTEVLDADESTVRGKLLATGLRGFFQERRKFADVMGELNRKYSINLTSGGSRDSVRSELEVLVAKDILDRQGDAAHGWEYIATSRFTERVRPYQEALA